MADKARVIDAFLMFSRAEQQRDAQALIADENLNEEAARRYITASLEREFASDNGTDLDAILPRMSPLNPHYLSKKHSVFRKIATFVDKFKGVGGQIWCPPQGRSCVAAMRHPLRAASDRPPGSNR